MSLVALVTDGVSATALTVIVNDCGPDVSTPPFAVPPLSCSVSVIVDVPKAFAAGVYVTVSDALTAGWLEKSALFVLFVTVNVSVWPDSSGGPALMLVAQVLTDCAPASSFTV